MLEFIKEVFFGATSKKEPKYLSAQDAFRQSMDIKEHTREACIMRIISEVDQLIKDDLRCASGPDLCVVRFFDRDYEKEVLPEVADHFLEIGYTVDLKNGEDYPITNILIISWQNQAYFEEPVEQVQ